MINTDQPESGIHTRKSAEDPEGGKLHWVSELTSTARLCLAEVGEKWVYELAENQGFNRRSNYSLLSDGVG